MKKTIFSAAICYTAFVLTYFLLGLLETSSFALDLKILWKYDILPAIIGIWFLAVTITAFALLAKDLIKNLLKKCRGDFFISTILAIVTIAAACYFILR